MVRKAPVSMIMTTPVITLKEDDSLERALFLFKKHHFCHIPIVDKKMVVGILSYADLLRLSKFNQEDDMLGDSDVMVLNKLTLKKVMSKAVVSVTSSCSIKEVANIFILGEFHALPVIDHDKLVGIVTTTDVIKYLAQQI